MIEHGLAISVENLGKAYRLGELNRRSFAGEVGRWLRGAGGKEEELFWALRDVSFEIHRGDTVGVIGKNGAGKSTLLKILSRVTAPTEGTVRLKGRLGSLLEVGSGFNPVMTGRENIYLNGSILGLQRAEIDRRFDEIVAFAGVEGFLDTPVKRYSSGMQMRLAFSVASFLEPEILILDEVLAVGDMAFRRRCMNRIEKLMQEGLTILFVSHDINSVTKFCNRVLWMEGGMLRFDGSAEEGCESYRKEQVAEAFDKVHRPDPDGVVRYTVQAEPPGNRLWTICWLEMRDGRGDRVLAPRLGEAVVFRVGFRCADPSRITRDSATANFVITDENARRVFSLRTDFLGTRLERLPESGVLEFRLPRLPLLPGQYLLKLALIANGESSHAIPVAAEFSVNDGDYYGSGVTPLRATTPLCVEAEARILAGDPGMVGMNQTS